MPDDGPTDLTEFELVHPRGITRHLYGRSALIRAQGRLEELLNQRRLFLLSSRPVLELHGQAVLDGLSRVASVPIAEVPDGEAAKRLSVVEQLAERLVRWGVERSSVLVSLGGGSVSDLVGFLAAVLHRGVSWVAFPTTLLAQLDAAVGGKTGVDLDIAKNAVGAFHPPLAVLADADWLPTLPALELRAGFVEAIKTAAVLDASLFAAIEARFDGLLSGDPDELAWLAASVARAKVSLVTEDLEDRGPRALLNFGHTLGHALEAVSGFSVSHGAAVAYGMRFVQHLAIPRGADRSFWARLLSLLDRLGLPEPPVADPRDLLSAIGRDKKVHAGSVRWVIPFRPGEASWTITVPEPELERALSDFLAARGTNAAL